MFRHSASNHTFHAMLLGHPFTVETDHRICVGCRKATTRRLCAGGQGCPNTYSVCDILLVLTIQLQMLSVDYIRFRLSLRACLEWCKLCRGRGVSLSGRPV